MTQDLSAEHLGHVFADAVERVAAGVVSVHGRQRLPGTGTVWASDETGTVIVTASHVVEREDQITVRIGDEEEDIPATLLGRDLSRDMAVLRIERNGIAPVELATAEPRVGTLTMAVGRPFIPSTQASLGTVVFVGSIRFRNYRTGRMIHADPTMYPGFSGGPLISSAGSVYGINTSGAAQAGGITIPAEQVSRIVADIVEHGFVQTPWLGITVQQVDLAPEASAMFEGQETALVVQSVNEGTPAEAAGLTTGDILIAMDGQPLEDVTDLQQVLCHGRIGESVSLVVYRDGTRHDVSVTTVARPEQP